jgi:hypothetical protein
MAVSKRLTVASGYESGPLAADNTERDGNTFSSEPYVLAHESGAKVSLLTNVPAVAAETRLSESHEVAVPTGVGANASGNTVTVSFTVTGQYGALVALVNTVTGNRAAATVVKTTSPATFAGIPSGSYVAVVRAIKTAGGRVSRPVTANVTVP